MLYKREIDDPVMIQYIILYTLATVGHYVTHNQLSNIVLENCNINFLNFQLALDNLVVTEHVRTLRIDDKTVVCELLSKGVDANEFFQSSIPIYIREPIRDCIGPFFNAEEQKRNVRAELMPLNENEFMADCKLYEGNSPLMELSFYAGSREMAVKMLEKFKHDPQKVYTAVLAALTPDADSDETTEE